jgi:hypothetical protein
MLYIFLWQFRHLAMSTGQLFCPVYLSLDALRLDRGTANRKTCDRQKPAQTRQSSIPRTCTVRQKLKRIVADLSLGKTMVQEDVLSKAMRPVRRRELGGT